MRTTSLARLIAPAFLLLATSAALAGPHKMEIMAEEEGALTSPATPPELRAKIYSRMKELGATHIRFNAFLHTEVPADEQEGMLKNLDMAVAEAHAAGLTVQMTVSTIAAPWGNYDKAPGTRAAGVNPSAETYLAFLKAVVARYHAVGVKRFSIWNEPNHPGFLLAGPDGAPYYDAENEHSALEAKAQTTPLTDAEKAREKVLAATMKTLWKKIIHENVKFMRGVWVQGYEAIKAIDPTIEVLLGELSSGEKKEGSWGARAFLEDVVRHAKKPILADGLAVHPYQFSTRPESKRGLPAGNAGISQLADLQKDLASLARRHRFETAKKERVPIFVTEFAYPLAAPTGKKSWGATRAAWAKRAFEVALEAGVREMEWYQLMPTGPGHGTWDTSILDANADPLGGVFRALEKWIANLAAHHRKAP